MALLNHPAIEINAAQTTHSDSAPIFVRGELVSMGLEDYLAPQAICLVEWPERGTGVLPEPDIELKLDLRDHDRLLNLNVKTARGEEILAALSSWRRKPPN